MTRPPMQRIALHWPDNLKFIPAAVHLNRDDSDARVIVMIVVEIGELWIYGERLIYELSTDASQRQSTSSCVASDGQMP